MNEYRGEVKPRRQGERHHITTSAALHSTLPVNDPFASFNNKQFPAMYIRSPMKNAYRSYMRMKSPYRKGS